MVVLKDIKDQYYTARCNSGNFGIFFHLNPMLNFEAFCILIPSIKKLKFKYAYLTKHHTDHQKVQINEVRSLLISIKGWIDSLD